MIQLAHANHNGNNFQNYIYHILLNLYYQIILYQKTSKNISKGCGETILFERNSAKKSEKRKKKLLN